MVSNRFHDKEFGICICIFGSNCNDNNVEIDSSITITRTIKTVIAMGFLSTSSNI